jgi:hypothetical protein
MAQGDVAHIQPPETSLLRRTAAVPSLLGMMRRIAALDGSINGEQQKLIDATERYFASRQKVAGGKWS